MTATTESPRDIKSILVTRGDTFDVAESIALKRCFDEEEIPEDDGGDFIPELEHLVDLTYKKNQQELVAEELEEMRRPKLNMQPLNINISNDTATTYAKIPPSALPYFAYDTPEPILKDAPQTIKQNTPLEDDITKEYILIEEKQQTAPPKRTLVYHSNLETKESKEFSVIKGENKEALRFEARIENGNLFEVIEQYKDPVYEIYIKPDEFTAYHCSYFNFKVCGFEPNVTYTFKIMNLNKYQEPIQPVCLINGEYRVVGEKLACYRSNQKQYTIQPYNSVLCKGYTNEAFIMEMDQFKENVKEFKTQLKKEGFTKKQMASPAGVVQEMSMPMFRFCFEMQFQEKDFEEDDVGNYLLTAELSRIFPYTYKNLLIYCERLELEEFNREEEVKMEVVQMCRSYLGNPIPIIKIYSESERGKNIVLIISRMHGNDSLSQFISEGVVKQLCGGFDYLYEDKIKKALEDKELILHQNLVQEFEEETVTRKEILSEFVFYMIPVFDVDGEIQGENKVNLFNQNYNRSFGTPGNFKNPQIQFINNLVSYCEEMNIAIEYVFDLKTSKKVKNFAFESNYEGVDLYKLLNLKLWDVLGRNCVVPLPGPLEVEKVESEKEEEDANNKQENLGVIFYVDDISKLSENDIEIQKIDTFYDDKALEQPKEQLLKQVKEDLREWIEQNNCFAEYAEFAELKSEFEKFDFQGSTFTIANKFKQNTARAFFYQNLKSRSYTAVAPHTYNSEDYELCGREVVRFLMFRYLQQGEPLEMATVDLQEDYLETVESAILQHFVDKKFKILDKVKYNIQQLQRLPDNLKMQSELNASEFCNFESFNLMTQVNRSLKINDSADNVSDSDDSDCDMDMASGKAPKLTAEEIAALAHAKEHITQIFVNWRPELQKEKKKKGKGKKGKK